MVCDVAVAAVERAESSASGEDAPLPPAPPGWELPQRDDRPRLTAAHRLASLPNAVWHVPDFVSGKEHNMILRCCAQCSNVDPDLTGRVLRLQNLGGYASQERRPGLILAAWCQSRFRDGAPRSAARWTALWAPTGARWTTCQSITC